MASENIINYRVTCPSNHFCQICILDGERPGISVIMLFSICKAKTRSFQCFFTQKFVYKDAIVRSSYYAKRRKVLCVYVDITVLI